MSYGIDHEMYICELCEPKHVVPILVPSSEEINIIIVSCRPNQPHICQINRAPMTIPSF